MTKNEIIEWISWQLNCPYDYYNKKFHKETDDPNLPDWYFKLCGSDSHFDCEKDELKCAKCWERFFDK